MSRFHEPREKLSRPSTPVLVPSTIMAVADVAQRGMRGKSDRQTHCALGKRSFTGAAAKLLKAKPLQKEPTSLSCPCPQPQQTRGPDHPCNSTGISGELLRNAAPRAPLGTTESLS